MSNEESFQKLEGLLTKLEQRLESVEQIVAQLMVGYMDMAVAVEITMQDALNKMDAEERKQFMKESFALRREMLDILKSSLQEDQQKNFNLDGETTLFNTMEQSLSEDGSDSPSS